MPANGVVPPQPGRKSARGRESAAVGAVPRDNRFRDGGTTTRPLVGADYADPAGTCSSSCDRVRDRDRDQHGGRSRDPDDQR